MPTASMTHPRRIWTSTAVPQLTHFSLPTAADDGRQGNNRAGTLVVHGAEAQRHGGLTNPPCRQCDCGFAHRLDNVRIDANLDFAHGSASTTERMLGIDRLISFIQPAYTARQERRGSSTRS